ncbi:MAG: ATP-binding cassette domain-containing protein, partial [Alphaproteobacteria bacterium]|nr:ATP-binding cassette domain-containing protein [Alphaproteobacteria bacterium]
MLTTKTGLAANGLRGIMARVNSVSNGAAKGGNKGINNAMGHKTGNGNGNSQVAGQGTSDQPLVMDNVFLRFGNLEVLKGVSLSAQKGEVVAILGSSGSGKSSLLRVIPLLDYPSEGRIIIQGQELKMKPGPKHLVAVSESQLRSLRAQVGFVFQNFNLWSHLTVMDNMILAPMTVKNIDRKTAIERAQYYLNKVNIAETHQHHYPIQLSGGQQ